MAGTGRLKEGYLKKYGNLLTRWRRKHFTVYQDGQLAWSDGSGQSPDKVVNVRTECSMLRVGAQVGTDAPSVPTGARKDFMFSMTAKGKNYYILAETEQDLVQWLEVLYQAKGIPHPSQQQQQQQQQPGAPVGGGGMPQPYGQQPYPSQAPPTNQPPAYGFNPNLTGQPPPPVAAAPYPPQAGGYPAQQPYQQQPYQQQPYQQQPYQQQPYQQQPRPAYPTQPGGPVATRPVHQTVVIQDQSRSYSRGGDGFATGLLAGSLLGGHHGWGWGYGGGHYGHGYGGGGLLFGGHHHHHDHFGGHHDHFGHHDHHDFGHHDHHDFGGHDSFGGGHDDFGGGGDFGGGDFGGGDFDGGDFGGD